MTVAVNSGSKLDTALIQQLVIGVLGRVADVKVRFTVIVLYSNRLKG